jgi:hypothetical protein
MKKIFEDVEKDISSEPKSLKKFCFVRITMIYYLTIIQENEFNQKIIKKLLLNSFN